MSGKKRDKEVCCVGVVEVLVRSKERKGKEWRLSVGFGSERHTAKHGEELRRKAMMLTRMAVEAAPEEHGFATGEKIEYKASINVLPCETLVCCRNGDN